jgi:hypothetical protein
MTNDKLRGVFEGLGLEDVASVLSNGNAVFRSSGEDAPVLGHLIEDALARELGISSRTPCAPTPNCAPWSPVIPPRRHAPVMDLPHRHLHQGPLSP